MHLILASNSPRRRELLTKMGYTFTGVPANIDESPRPGEPAETYVTRMAYEKGFYIAQGYKSQQATILSADTIVVLGSKILGKPADSDDAAQMLTELSGKTHRVITAFCLIQTPHFTKYEESVITAVTFRDLTASEIRDYVATGEPLDKAGAYAIQGLAAKFVTEFLGDHDNVVGLPSHAVEQALKSFVHS